MNLEQLLGTIKRSYLPIAGLGVLVLFVLAGYIWIDNPSGDQGFGKIPSPKFKSIVNDNDKVETRGTDLKVEIPKLVNIYTFSQQISIEDLAKKLGFSTKPAETDKELVFLSEGSELSVNKVEKTFKYKLTSPVGEKKINEDQAISLVTNRLNDLGLIGSETSLVKVSTKYLDSSLYHINEVAPTNNFNVWVFQIGATVEGKKVIKGNGSNIIYSVWMGIDSEIQRLEGSWQTLKFNEKSTYPTKHLSQIKRDIGDNKTTLVNLAVPLSKDQEGKSKVVFNKGEVSYLLDDSEERLLQPVFLLSNGSEFERRSGFGLLRLLKDQVYQ